MLISPHSEIADLLPGLGGRIPPQDLVEVVIIPTAGHIDMIFNHCCSQITSWCWKAAGLPPLQLASTSSVDGNLVGVRVSVGKEFIYSSATLPLSVFMLVLMSF